MTGISQSTFFILSNEKRVKQVLHLNLMEMPMTEWPLFTSVPEMQDNTLGVVRRTEVINNFKSEENGSLLI